MTTVAIICEYNPFHKGHEYHINRIREEFGKDTAIIAIMSGNFTQRGDIAITDKGLRAKCAVDCGVNLVVELPFPYSLSSAEIFAKAGVHIANSLGIVDYLSFGSEDGNIERLISCASCMLSKDFIDKLEELKCQRAFKEEGYAKVLEKALELAATTEIPKLCPNNILALEYIKELMRLNSEIRPHTIKRDGADYNEENITTQVYQSATAIRNALINNDSSALDFTPLLTKYTFLHCLQNGDAPCDADKLSAAIISHFRLNSPRANTDICDADGGLYNRLISASLKTNTLSDLVNITQTKKYTNARIRRVIWYSFFGVTSSEIKTMPEYTQILAMDSYGREVLKKLKKRSAIPLINKPTNTEGLSDMALKQKKLSDVADSVFELTKPNPKSGVQSLVFTPYVKL